MNKFKLGSILSILFFTLLVIGLNISLTALRYSSSPPVNRCGLYGTQPTCAACHTPGSGGTGSASISVSGDPTSYTLGAVYAITVTGLQTSPAVSKYGFELAAVDASNANAGSFTSVAGVNIGAGTVSGNSISFIRHSTPRTSGTWTFNWTAPPTNVGDIRFYLAINAVNGTGGTSGDYVYTNVLTLTAPCTPPIATLTSNTHSICNDVSDFDLNTLVATSSAAGIWTGIGVSNGNTFSPSSVGIGTYSLTFTTGTGTCTDSQTLTETVTLKPTPIITGNNNVCAGDIGTYSVQSIAGTTYQWQVTGGNIVSGGGINDNTITINWTSTAGTLHVIQTQP